MTPYNKLIERRNAGDKISNDDVRDALISTIRGIDNLKDLNDFLCTFHASDAYTVIVEYVKPKNNELIQNASKNDIDEYKRFQDITIQARDVHNYEKRTATMFDVNNISNKVAMKYYNIAVRMICKVDDELGRAEEAINIIEDRLGLIRTSFKEELDNDTTESGNVQRVEETTE